MSRFKCVPIVVWIAALLVGEASCAADPPAEASAIFESFLQPWQKLHSIQFEMEFDLPGEAGHWPRRMEVAATGKKFRYTAFDIPLSSSGEVSDNFQAFDGELYQFLDSQQRTLAITQNPELRAVGQAPYPTVLWMPFWWLFRPGEIPDWHSTQDRDRWNQILSMAREVRTIDEGESPSLRVSFQNPQGYWWEVDFRPDLGYFPIRSFEQSKSREIVAVTVVTEWSEFEFDGDRLVIPTYVVKSRESQVAAGNRQYLRSAQVVDGTLRVNEPLPESLFTIDRSSVSVIYNLDTGILTNIAANQQVQLDSAGNPVDQLPPGLADLAAPNRTAVWLLLLNVFGLIVIGAVYLNNNRRRSGGSADG
jgi:hypothetical protein